MRRPHLTRRTLLQALTTGIAAAPFGAPRRARAARPAAPRRVVVYWSPNGTVHDKFWPTDPADLKTSEILSPLAAFQDRMIVSHATYHGTGDHKTGLPFSTSATPTRFGDPGSTISIDQEIANALKGQTPVASLVTCAQSKDGNERGYISANIDGSRNPPTKNPATAWEFVFGPYQGGMPPAPENLSARKSILDGVIKDLEAMQTKFGPAEKIKLQSHLDAIRDLEKKLGQPMDAGCSAENLVAPDAQFDYHTRTNSHLDLITAAFACDMTRVVSFMTAPAGHDNCNFSFIGVEGGMHGGQNEGWSHKTTKDQPMLNEADLKMTSVHKYHAERLAYLLQKLDEIPEGDGSVLDNTAVLWLNECSHGNHGHTPVPIVIAGSLGGYLKVGQVIKESQISHGKMLITIANGMGHALETFGNGFMGQLPEILA